MTARPDSPMQGGMAAICQNPDQKISDYEVYKNEIRLADLAEPLGFDSIGSVERFVEAADMILTGLEQGYCEYEGEYYHQPKKAIRPNPFKSFKGRTYAAAVSPESSEIQVYRCLLAVGAEALQFWW